MPIRNSLSAMMMCGVAAYALTAPAQAQAQAQAQDSPAARFVEKEQSFSIPAGPLVPALNAWAKQTGRSIIFQSKDLASSRTAGVRGRMSSEDALNQLLKRSGLTRLDGANGSVAIVSGLVTDNNINNTTPEILVKGRRSWSLNTGVERSQDDSQPFIVMTAEEIQRSGSPNLETFLRDRLNVNASPGVSEQVASGNPETSPTRGLSSVNLRGLGTRDTLILIDGRRQPGVNFGNGTITQASITNIPIASIERIEVLASSASGIYGSGASGGVINIVLKRDFTGGQVSATYSDTTDFAQGQGQIDVTYGAPVEGGRTRLSFAGSWMKSRPLLLGDRNELTDDAVDFISANNPNFARTVAIPPNATTPNFKTLGRQPLQLKPQYGGATLAAGYGSVPVGYRGVALDGVAPLLAGIGSYNFNPSNTTANTGLRAPLLYGSERVSGSLSARREFNRWLTGYAGVTLASSDSVDYRSRDVASVILNADAPGNPFTRQILVTLPAVTTVATIRNRQRKINLIAGAIARLPGGWQAALDLSYSRGRFDSDRVPSLVNDATVASLRSGAQNILRDVIAQPLTIGFDNLPFYSAQTPGLSSTFAPSLRIAGPIPVTLPGGRPQVTMNLEYNDERIAAVAGATNTAASSVVSYIPAAKQQTYSFYGEVSFPLIGPATGIPLVRELELRISGRGEGYRGNGANPVNCDSFEGPLPERDPFASCPPAGETVGRGITSNSHVDPSISLRWVPITSIMLRGSYTTGYLPPTLDSLIRIPTSRLLVLPGDPLRGNEVIGIPSPFGAGQVVGFIGGNPDVRPESSRTFTAGVVLTPTFVPGLRFSADWTYIRKRDVYFDPVVLITPFGLADPAAFGQFLAANPDRAIRGPASGGFTVGPITSLDVSMVNLNGLSTKAIDFVLDYHHDVFGGVIDVVSRATYVDSLKVDSFPGTPPTDYAGVVSSGFAIGVVSNGSMRWRGNAAINWSKDALTLGWQLRYFGRYALNVERDVDISQGSAYVDSQIYHDINGSYRFNAGITVRAGINNILNKRPPIDATASPKFYSAYGDPRLRSFYLSVSKAF